MNATATIPTVVPANDNAVPFFAPGTIYHLRLTCDHNAILNYEILDRKGAMPMLRELGETKLIRCRVKTDDGIEYVRPEGYFLRASRIGTGQPN